MAGADGISLPRCNSTLSGRSGEHGGALHVFDLLELHGELVVMLFTGALMVAFVFANCLHTHHISFIPESLVVICLGLVMGLLIVWIPEIGLPTIEQDSILNKKLLGMMFLPIIIFEAGFTMKTWDFAAQLPYILIFAILGTVICMLVVAFLILATSDLHGISQPRIAFAYGALISAVDPVATLATYAHLNVEPLLSIMVMGESIINDAVAIVLFDVLNEPPVDYFRDKSVLDLSQDISLGVLKLLFGSVGLGLGLGFIYILILRHAHMSHSPALEILFIFFSCFFSYALAEHVVGMSGIITVLFNGMFMGSYSMPHLTLEGKLLCSFLLKQMASLADMSVFLFVGIGLVYSTSNGLYFGCFVMVFCLIGRALAVGPLGVLTNCIKKRTENTLDRERRLPLTARHLFMMWHAGLRGGIAVVLVLGIGDWVDELHAGSKEILRNATLLLVCVFLLVFGGSTEFFLKALDIPIGNPPKMFMRKGFFHKLLVFLRDQGLRPILVGDRPVEKQMPGGIVKQILEEASSHHPVDAQISRIKSNSNKERYDVFGNTDPSRFEDSTEADTAGESDFDRWMRLHGSIKATDTDGCESASSLESDTESENGQRRCVIA